MSYLPEIPEINNKKKDKTLLNHVISELGGVVFATEAIDKTLSFASIFFKKNNFYQNTIKVLRKVNPGLVTGYKIHSSVKSFREDKKQLHARQKKSLTIIDKMGLLGQFEEYELESCDFDIGKEVINWFSSKPKTDDFRIIEFYNSEFEPFSIRNFEKGECYILVEFKSNRFMIEADISLFNGHIIVQSCTIHTVSEFDKIRQLKTTIFGEFVKSFDTLNNVIEITGKGLETRPRLGFEYPVSQFDVDGLRSEISKAIKKDKKRGYIMVGPPGVGKSTVIIKLEKELPNVPIVYVRASSSSFGEDIRNVFNFLRSISPCIAIFEDLDAYELSNKKDRLFGEFIEQMDSLKHSECLIVIATLNEPENVHPSLINRRGRFDKVYFVDYPKDEKMILSVIKNKYNKEMNKDFPYTELPKNLVEKMTCNNFTHADICEVIDSLIINDIEVNLETIEEGINQVIKTMNAVSMCEGDE